MNPFWYLFMFGIGLLVFGLLGGPTRLSEHIQKKNTHNFSYLSSKVIVIFVLIILMVTGIIACLYVNQMNAIITYKTGYVVDVRYESFLQILGPPQAPSFYYLNHGYVDVNCNGTIYTYERTELFPTIPRNPVQEFNKGDLVKAKFTNNIITDLEVL